MLKFAAAICVLVSVTEAVFPPADECFDENMWVECNWDGILNECMASWDDHCTEMFDWWRDNNSSLMLFGRPEASTCTAESSWSRDVGLGAACFAAGALATYGILKRQAAKTDDYYHYAQ